MYDNIDFILPIENCPGIDFLKNVPQFLTNVYSWGNYNNGEYCSGYLESLKVNITDNRIKIANSSLCKYYLGDNFKTLSKGDTRRAIEKISDSLHIPFSCANVTRIDLAQNLIMQNKEDLYYKYLGEAQFYKRLEQSNGLYYNNQKRQLVFYGKEYEQRVKRQPIPELYKDRNVLRFELRFKNRLGQQLKQPAIKACLLYDESFYGGLVRRWKDEYLAIQKIHTKLKKMKPTGSKKEFAESLALFTVLELGQPQVLSKVKEWQDMGEISKKQAYDLRVFIKNLTKIQTDDEGTDLIDELDRKIKEAARYY